MKITFEILGIILLVFAAVSLTMFFLQRRREQAAQRDGLVLYATLLTTEPLRWLGKVDMRKIVLRIQEPDSEPREVSIRSRVEKGQKFTPGAMIPVVLDPKDAKRVYPATPESAKRVVLTGSRQQRRIMQSQLRSPSRSGQRPPSGYQPPVSKLR